MEASREGADGAARSGDLYLLGRIVSNHVADLLLALRATGDRRFLDRVHELGVLTRSTLTDRWLDGTRDGFLNWRWLADPDEEYYYGNDLHRMDEAMTHGMAGNIALALWVNRGLDPAYAAEAGAWRDYLVNHFLPKWTARAGGDPVAAWEDPRGGFYKRFTHPRSNQLQLAHALWRITGEEFYRERMTVIASDLVEHIQINPEHPQAYIWKHQLWGGDEGWQKMTYCMRARERTSLPHSGRGTSDFASRVQQARRDDLPTRRRKELEVSEVSKRVVTPVISVAVAS